MNHKFQNASNNTATRLPHPIATFSNLQVYPTLVIKGITSFYPAKPCRPARALRAVIVHRSSRKSNSRLANTSIHDRCCAASVSLEDGPSVTFPESTVYKPANILACAPIAFLDDLLPAVHAARVGGRTVGARRQRLRHAYGGHQIRQAGGRHSQGSRRGPGAQPWQAGPLCHPAAQAHRKSLAQRRSGHPVRLPA